MLNPEDIDRQRLAWLLRPDLRDGKPASARIPAWFQQWWLLHQHELYPTWPAPSRRDYAPLFAPLEGKPKVGPFAMHEILRTLLRTRDDLRRAFDVSTPDGYAAALAWFHVHGLRELELQNVLPSAQLQALDAPAAPLAIALKDQLLQQPLTWLMYFVWQQDMQLQRNFALGTSDGQAMFLSWFLFYGVAHLGLAPLVAPRWREWLWQPLTHRGPKDVVLPRLALMLWRYRDDLRRVFDLHSDEGLSQLVSWLRDHAPREPSLKWLFIDNGQQEEPGHAGPGASRAKRRGTSSAVPTAARPRPFGVNLVGFAFGQLGIGEDVRMATAACEQAGIPFRVVNIHPGSAGVADRALARHVGNGTGEAAPYDVNIFCLTGFDTARTYLEQGLPLFAGRYNIGWWPWELPVWPRDWDMVFGLVDEVWAATTFTEAMYRKAAARTAQGATPQGIASTASMGRTPVTLMPLPASIARVKPVTRKALALPARRFLFLYVFDFNSYLDRKNPFAVIKAFRKAFPTSDKSVGLVLKTMNSRPDNPAWKRFVKTCAGDARITLIDFTLDRGKVLGLIKACDAYVSLHRSEGFGRTLAEAMLFGKPVVGTDFSGNVDFLNDDVGFPVRWTRRAVKEGEYPFIAPRDRAWWADPDVADAARQMQAARQAAMDPAFSRRVLRYAREKFSPGRIGVLMRERLEAVMALRTEKGGAKVSRQRPQDGRRRDG